MDKKAGPDMAHRLSGAPRERHYTRSFKNVDAGGRYDPYEPTHRRKGPRKPYKSPHKKYRENRPKKQPVREPLKVPLKPAPSPVPKIPLPNPLGGMSKAYRKFLPLNPYLRAADMLLNLPVALLREGGQVYPFDLAGAGFILLKECPPVGGYTYIPGVSYSGPDDCVRGAFGDPGLSCSVTGQTGFQRFNPTTGALTTPFNVTTPWMAYGPYNQGTVGRMQIRQQWWRPGGGPAVAPSPTQYPKPVYGEWPELAPYVPGLITFDPLELPIGQPVPQPQPVPYKAIPGRKTNPMRAPSEQTQWGKGDPSPSPSPVGPPIPPNQIPVDETVITPPPPGSPPGTPPVVGPKKPGRHVKRPPQKNEREKKMRTNLPGPLDEIIGALGEAGDVLNAFFESLPPEVRRDYKWKGGDPLDRLAFVLENLDKVQITELVPNLIAMLVEDAVFGKLGKAQKDANNILQKNFGINISGRLPKAYLKPFVG